MTDISFIVSAYNRPEMLECCLASLRTQTHKNIDIAVADNATDADIMFQHEVLCWRFGARLIRTQALTCYHSAEIAAKYTTGEYLCFPSDDSYYVPTFAAEMVKYGRFYDLDLVYCDMVYNGRTEFEPYFHFDVQPKLNAIDKTNFIVRRSVFPGFPDKPNDAVSCAADGLLIERLVKAGASHRKHPGVMVVHN